MKIDEKVFEKIFAKICNDNPEEIDYHYASFISREVLIKYLAEIEKPICIKKIKKNTMIIRTGK